MRRLLVLALALLPAAAAAQEGRIAFSRSVQYDFEVPERWASMKDQIPSQSVTELVLLFNASESVMKPAPKPEDESRAGRGGDRAELSARAEGMAARLKMGSSSRSDQETLLESYVSFEAGIMSETREFVGRTFLISDERPAYAWKLGGEQRAFLGHVVQKATAEHDGSTIEAWFTTEIPVQGGPGPYGGLPGMILLVSIDEGHTLYAATEIDLSGLGGEPITPPNEGSMVTRAEYEDIVAEKLEEIRTLRGAGDRRRPF